MKYIPFLISFSFLFFSCKKNNVEKIETCDVVITHRLANPYTIPIEKDFDKQNPTHQYLKFHIYNATEYNFLVSNGVFLLDHPFDAVPNKNYEYTTEHTKQYGVYYGVVPTNVDVSQFTTEKVSDLYMPVANPVGKLIPKTFSGTVTFFDPIDSIQVPLQGIRVIIKDATKFVYAITDTFGNFSVTTNALVADTAEILLQFDNSNLEIHTLDLTNLFGVFGINTYSLGFKRSCGFTNLNIAIGRSFNNAALHHSCAALLSYNQFKKFAHQNGLLMPTQKMLIWLGKEAPLSTSYAAPMLHNMADQNIANTTQLIENLLGVPADIADLLAIIVKSQLPDIYAPFYNRYATAARVSFMETLYHEFSHTSHYTKVGPQFWMPYVEYIYTHGGYGQPNFTNSGIVGLSESFAEDLSYMCAYSLYHKQQYINLNENPVDDWIPYGLYYDLYDNSTNEPFDQVSNISFTQVYNLLDVNTRSLATLKQKLKNNFPAQQAAIEILFRHYGF